jgi:trk system potassium uptake protein TrkA
VRILIIGAGEVGRFIAERLLREGHDLVVLDTNPTAISRINDLDVYGVVGDGTDPQVLRENGIDHTDLVVAVSQVDSVNLTACNFAGRLGATRSVARLSHGARSPEDERLAREAFGVDWVINPDEEAAREIAGLLEGRQITDSLEFDGGAVRVVGMRVDEGSPLADRSLSELRERYPDANILVVAMVRDGETIIPRGNHRVLAGDRLYLIGGKEDLRPFLAAEEGPETRTRQRRFLIVGGGQVGASVAARLEAADFDVRLLESDRERSEELAVSLPRTTVLHGDGTNLTALRECGVTEVDGFVAVSGDEETNVMSALLARHLGAPKVVALVKRTDYIPVLKEIGLDAAVNPRLTAAGAILRFVRRGHILQVATFKDIDAEVLELAASESSRVVGRPLKDVKFPRDAIIGGYSRDGHFGIPHGDTVLQAHDRVIVFAQPSAIGKVEKMFSLTR